MELGRGKVYNISIYSSKFGGSCEVRRTGGNTFGDKAKDCRKVNGP